MASTLEMVVSPAVVDFWRERGAAWGPGLAGALFGAGTWLWIDAIATTTAAKIPFVQWLPGIVAFLALVMINAVRRDELMSTDPFDEGIFCRARFWLLSAYIVSVGSVVGSVLVMLRHFAEGQEGDRWTGVACVLEVACILGAALMLFASRSPGDTGGYSEF